MVQSIPSRARASTPEHCTNSLPLPPTTGVFNEEAFQALDFILDEAARSGMKVVLVPLNFWNKGVSRFEEWWVRSRQQAAGRH